MTTVYDALTQCPFFFYFVHHLIKKKNFGSWLCFRLQEKKRLT